MAARLSPGVQTREFSFDLVVPNLSTTESGCVGGFSWGPVEQPILIDSEEELVSTFWKPNNTNANDWFTASQYLSYASALWTVRMVDDNAANTALRATNASGNTGFLVKNDDIYENMYNDGSLKLTYNTGEWIAKFAGDLGNNLKVAQCTGAAAFQSNLTGTLTVAANGQTVTGVSTLFTTQTKVGDVLLINNETHKVSAVANTTSLTLATKHVSGAAANTATRYWEYYNEFDTAPGTSPYVSDKGGSADELHVIVIDRTGVITGTPDTVLEKYPFVSKASDAKTLNGEGNFYKNVINDKSDWIRWAGHLALSNIGSPSLGTTFGTATLPTSVSLQNGRDGQAITNNEKIVGFNFFKDVEELDISFILGSDADSTLAVYIINNIVEKRQDCIALFSVPKSYVVNNKGHEATDCIVFRQTLPSTSYAALDSNWKYTYDRYNDVYRYVPMNGDTAGINVRTTEDRDAWWPAAGFNRGNVKNVTKLAWNPKETDRDQLYKNGINPYVIFKNEGPVLYGQKTLLAKPSSFDRINVRRLFIVMRKAIARSARYFLFEFNDEITRRQFKNLVEPYLRDVKGRRGITAFAVKCDETNNTPTVIERNEFVGSIAVRPNYSAEFITLNFASVSGNVTFEEAFSQIT